MKCPNCDVEMRALFTTLYCAHATPPETACRGLRLVIKGLPWRVSRVPKEGSVPTWATHAWHLSGDEPCEDPSKSDAELIMLLENRWRYRTADDGPGWPISGRNDYVTGTYSALVFGRMD